MQLCFAAPASARPGNYLPRWPCPRPENGRGRGRRAVGAKRSILALSECNGNNAWGKDKAIGEERQAAKRSFEFKEFKVGEKLPFADRWYNILYGQARQGKIS